MGESAREWTTATDAPFPSTAAIWQEIDLAERYLVCSMFEEAASMASSIVGRLRTCGFSESVEGNELVDIMESAGMVFVQSLKELKRTSELITELKELFGTVAAVPGQVFLTGACMQIAEGSTSTIRATFEEFLGEWKYVEGHSLLFLNEEEKCTTSYGIKWSHLSLEKFLDIVEVYAITILGVVVNDIDLAISWTEKAELPEERRQEILRRLHSFFSAKHSSSPVVSALSQLVDTTNKLDVSGATEKSLKDQNQKHHELDITKSERSSSTYRSLLNHIASSFWSFHSIPLKCGNATLILPRGKIIIWSSLVFFVYYVLQRKRATLQRFAARNLQVSSLKRALIDAWQLAFSVQVNPLAAIQPVTSAPHGSR
ncbi:hypothetical protein Taro_040337 [Colocasia esculenta]|uniref:Uncharacterized protein n=1 Tax=Colocasia esculenta TaxID=4460 RepID=A0A843WU98_COLES|nr:hypothetical protein [Colocasia esculenta]